MSSLRYLIQPFFDAMHKESLSYCVCGNFENLPEHTSHDVDIWTDNIERVEKLLYETAKSVNFILFLRNKIANGSNNFFYTENENSEFDVVRIDLLKECAWKSIVPLVTSKDIKESIVKYRHFYVADRSSETAMQFLYSLLNTGMVKDKYKNKIFECRNDEKFKTLITKAVGKKTAIVIFKHINNLNWDKIQMLKGKLRIIATGRALLHMNIARLKMFKDFIKTGIDRLLHPSGLFIAFIGTDGAGKTTITGEMEEFISKAFLVNKKFYWRPYKFPPLRKVFGINKIHDKNPEVNKDITEQRQENFNFFVSSVKFLYYVLDYIIGILLLRPIISKGGLLLFDRYFYDMIVYPQRFAMKPPICFMKFFSKLVPKPDITFFLYADAALLHDRKKEICIVELSEQLKNYNELISGLPNSYKIDSTKSLREVKNEIIRLCLYYMSQKNSGVIWTKE
jgi:thymidylate kinase